MQCVHKTKEVVLKVRKKLRMGTMTSYQEQTMLTAYPRVLIAIKEPRWYLRISESFGLGPFCCQHGKVLITSCAKLSMTIQFEHEGIAFLVTCHKSAVRMPTSTCYYMFMLPDKEQCSNMVSSCSIVSTHLGIFIAPRKNATVADSGSVSKHEF